MAVLLSRCSNAWCRIASPRARLIQRSRSHDGSCATASAFRMRVGDRARGQDARAGRHLHHRTADPRHGRQGLRTGDQCGRPTRHRPGLLLHARRALGVRVSDRRRRRLRSRPRRRPVRRGRGLRHLLRGPDALYRHIPAGVGSTGRLHLNRKEMDAMLTGGALWAVERSYGTREDLGRIEEHGCMTGAKPQEVSDQAKRRQEDEVGTLGSGNHYLEVQHVVAIYAPEIAEVYGLKVGDVVVSIHCGSRGLGHQIGTDFLKRMVLAAGSYGIVLPDRELACAPINSEVGQAYLGAMRAGMNCALANRQVITHLVRETFAEVLPRAELTLLYDVSHNTCKVEEHHVNGDVKRLFIHRKGATRAFGPGHPDVPEPFRAVGQPVLIGGTMGTGSYILCGTAEGMRLSFGSACHGAGRSMSRTQATKKWRGREVVDELARRGILIRSPSFRGVAEEAPGAYKDVSAVVDATEQAKLARKVARLEPLLCVKG